MKKIIGIVVIIFVTLSLIVPALASTFEMERPSDHITVDERFENAYADEEAAVGIGVHIHEYLENALTPPWSGRDGFSIRVVGTANTRKGIWYNCETSQYDAFPGRPWLPNDLFLGDDQGAWISIGFPVTFYSGPGLQNGSLYSEVWICSNGFLCFNDEYITSSPPPNVPKPQSPNAFLAPYWCDLDPSGGTIKYGVFNCVGDDYFGVEWDVLDKTNGIYQNFAVYIQKNDDYYTRKQNTIIFQY